MTGMPLKKKNFQDHFSDRVTVKKGLMSFNTVLPVKIDCQGGIFPSCIIPVSCDLVAGSSQKSGNVNFIIIGTFIRVFRSLLYLGITERI
jgi:hypothetical protein